MHDWKAAVRERLTGRQIRSDAAHRGDRGIGAAPRPSLPFAGRSRVERGGRRAQRVAGARRGRGAPRRARARRATPATRARCPRAPRAVRQRRHMASGSALRRPRPSQESRVHDCRGGHPRARCRRQHRDFHRYRRQPVTAGPGRQRRMERASRAVRRVAHSRADPAIAARAAGRGRPRAADRLCECRQPAPGTRRRSTEGVLHPGRGRRVAGPHPVAWRPRVVAARRAGHERRRRSGRRRHPRAGGLRLGHGAQTR